MLKITDLFIDGGRIRDNCRYSTIDTESPVFSWAAFSDKGDNMQTECRVKVYGADLLWDSGWVKQTTQSLKYDGKRLPHGIMLALEITLRDSFGEQSELYSATFVSGLLDADEMHGKWITSAKETNGKVMYFRRDITLTEIPESACLYVCGLGYHHATVGGKDVTEARLEPAHSNYAKNVYYTVHPDVSKLLTIGKNVIGIQVADGWRNNSSQITLNATGGRSIEFFGPAQLWAMLVLRFADGRYETVATDEKWGVKFGAITYASIFHGETYDSRVSDDEWNIGDAVGFEPAVQIVAPRGAMRPMSLEPIMCAAEYTPIEITTPKPCVFVIDFGQNIAGVARLTLPRKLTADQVITLRFAEELDEDGTLYTATLRDAKCTDTYIASGDSRDLTEWEPHFTYHGFRYAEVTGLDDLDKKDITARLLCTDLKNNSRFTCGSGLVNEIQKSIVMTEMDNMHSILTDCPQRDERMAWMNDATVRFEETPYNFDIGRMYKKIVRDIRAEQRDEGQFSCCAPYFFGNVPADPVCSSYLVAAYQSWMHMGDTEILRESFDGLCAWEDFLLSQSDDYIVNYSYYGDWAAPYYACEGQEIDSAASGVTEGKLMSTGYSYYNCRLLTQIATVLGYADKAAHYEKIGEKVKEAFLAKWFDGKQTVGSGSQGAQAFALWLGILPKEAEQLAADLMASDLVNSNYRFTTGNLTTRYLFDMLTKFGYKDVAWTLLTKEDYPSIGYMLQNEATTIWERFELKKSDVMNSHNHPMFGAVGYYLYAYIAGITPTAPAWERIRIAPIMPSGLCSAHAVVATVKGDISVRWSNRYGKNRLFVQIPFGAVADVDFCGVTKTLGSGYHVIEAE